MLEMSSKNVASRVQHKPVPLTDVEDSFSDDELDEGDAVSESDQSYTHRRGITMNHCKIFFGIAIGIGVGIIIGGSISSPGPNQMIPAPADAIPAPADVIPAPADAGIMGNSSVWLIEDMAESVAPFLLTSENSAKEKCESLGSNRVWLMTEDDGTKGQCLGRCGNGNAQGSADKSRGSGRINVDACGRHDHCCHSKSLAKSPDDIDSCVCWASTLIPVEDKVYWK